MIGPKKMNGEKILMISPVPVLPQNTGGRVRIWQIANNVADHLHVTLVLPVQSKVQKDRARAKIAGRNLSLECVSIEGTRFFHHVKHLASRWPYHASLRYSEQMDRKVQTLLFTGDFSKAYVHFIYGLPYVRHSDIPVILDQQNLDRVYWRRKALSHPCNLLTWINLVKTIRFEERMLPHASTIVSVSQTDRLMTRQLVNRNTRLVVAPNGVDLRHYARRPDDKDALQGGVTIGFLGSLDLAANHDAALYLCKEIVPRVKQQLGERHLKTLIIGRRPRRSLQRFARKRPWLNVTVTGTVPDILPYLHKVDILVLPLKEGSGSKLRVAEAMAAGVAVVGSPLALAGYEHLTPGEDAMCASGREQFVNATVELVNQPARRLEMVQSARAKVERHYSWSRIGTDLCRKLQRLY